MNANANASSGSATSRAVPSVGAGVVGGSDTWPSVLLLAAALGLSVLLLEWHRDWLDRQATRHPPPRPHLEPHMPRPPWH